MKNFSGAKEPVHVCHRIGELGYALRGPNLGESGDGLAIPQRAVLRATELGLKGASEYLVQSITRPAAFIVPGYTNEMPEIFRAPVSLSPSEGDGIIRYLLSLNGDSFSVEIRLPIELWNTSPTDDFQINGNAENGRRLFFDRSGPAACVSCHVAVVSADSVPVSETGPDLSMIARIRTPRYLYEKIVNPDSNLVSGYKEVFIRTNKNRFLFGSIQKEDKSSVLLKQRNGELIDLAREEIVLREVQGSPMPENYAEILSDKEIHDLVAFLLSQSQDRDH